MRKILFLALLLTTIHNTTAQNAVVEESLTDVECISPTSAIIRFKEVKTILNEHGAVHATFVCSCSKNDKLSSFKGQVTDAQGHILRKMKQSELQRTEYSQYLAIDNYKLYVEYTPPAYPVTITYEWTIESHDNLIEFPTFCPQSDYDVGVKKATYRLKAPKSMQVRHALLNIDKQKVTEDNSSDFKCLSIEMDNLPPIKQEPYSRPLRERLPIAFFSPTKFVYYGTQGSLSNWNEYGKWEYSLIEGRDELPNDLRQELHRLTDNLKSDRDKVEAIYKRLENTTRYVAILLGIGGQQPAPASSVAKSGFGDCKGLTNYMRAMLKEIDITSYYTTISTTNRRLLNDFPSIGQMNHVILQVPLPNDTLWLECTNPQLPMGYVHNSIAGHDAIEVSESGGKMVRLPVYPDTANLMRNDVCVVLAADGSSDITLSLTGNNCQYESLLPLLKMNKKELQEALQKIMHITQAENCEVNVKKNGACLSLDATMKSKQYATVTGQRIFVPICPLHYGYTAPKATSERQEDIWIETGYLDEDCITIRIPEGYEIEAIPKEISLKEPFGEFNLSYTVSDNQITVNNRLLIKSGTYDKVLFPQLTEYIKNVGNTYRQKMVLKRK